MSQDDTLGTEEGKQNAAICILQWLKIIKNTLCKLIDTAQMT
jgi:hypothetical protein